MGLWMGLLAGCVVFGAGIVGGLVLPRIASTASLLIAVAALVGAINALGRLLDAYGTPEALTVSLVVLVTGITAGYAVAASALPHLAPPPRIPRAARTGATDERPGIVVMCCTEPRHYSPRAVAARQNLLWDSAEIHVPMTALPFVFFADKARYRAVGGTSPGAVVGRAIATALELREGLSGARVGLAWCHSPSSLAEAVGALDDAGARSLVIIVLGPSESAELDAAAHALDHLLRDRPGLRVSFAPSIWLDNDLPGRLVTRILGATASAPPAEVGVVLVGAGAPPVWERRYSGAGEIENYFDQRVRVLLADAGVDDRHVRRAWIDWQTPDVTESVRHLAALGCTSIVVAPSTVAVPTLETTLDIGHAISLARVPAGVRVVSLMPWGDSEELITAAHRSAIAALGELKTD